MKRTILVSMVLLLASALAFAEGSTVTLQNQEGAVFRFLVDPEGLSDVSAASQQLAQRVEQFFAEETGGVSFMSLAPDSQLTLEGLEEGPHLLVGYFDVEGDDSLPVRAFSVQVDKGPGDRFYSIFSGPALLSVYRAQGKLAALALAASSSEEAAEAVEAEVAEAEVAEAEVAEAASAEQEAPPTAPAPIAQFSATYSPVVFTRESRGGFTVLPISQSLYWEEKGTRLDSLDGAIVDGTLRVSLRSADGFSRDVSYFFYLFASRTLGKENMATVELLPLAREGQGACVLWQRSAVEGKAAAAARIIGSVRASEYACDLEIDLASLPAETVAELGENPSIDLCSCRHDAQSGVFEEFYFTTIQLADISASMEESATR